MNPDSEAHEPSVEELAALTNLGRFTRLLAQGVSMAEALREMEDGDANADQYLSRNEQAMAELEKRLQSPEYMERFAAAMNEPDPEKKADALADLKRDNFASIDMVAVHRTIAARNRHLKAEGVLPPDAPI